MNKQKGFSLLEILISMALGLLLLAMLLRIYVWQLQINDTIQDEIFLQENSRLALQMLGNEIRTAGYLSCIPLGGIPSKLDAEKIITIGPNQLELLKMSPDNKNNQWSICNQVQILTEKFSIRNNALYSDNVEVVSGVDQLSAYMIKPGVVAVTIHLTAPHGMTTTLESVFVSRELPS